MNRVERTSAYRLVRPSGRLPRQVNLPRNDRLKTFQAAFVRIDTAVKTRLTLASTRVALSLRGAQRATWQSHRRDAAARSAVKTVLRRLFLAKAAKQLCCERGGKTNAAYTNKIRLPRGISPLRSGKTLTPVEMTLKPKQTERNGFTAFNQNDIINQTYTMSFRGVSREIPYNRNGNKRIY